MKMINRFKDAIHTSIAVKHELLVDELLLENFARARQDIVYDIKRGNRIIFARNGGSAADAQRLAAEFVSRFAFDSPGSPALSLSTDTSMIMGIGNDYGYERLFLRQLQAQSSPGDIYVGITTSGRSPNVLRAFEAL